MLSDDHVAVFDELMTRLIEHIERQALIELSGKLAPVSRAPANVIGLLSNNDDIEVAGPVLEQSSVLDDGDLIAIARSGKVMLTLPPSPAARTSTSR